MKPVLDLINQRINAAACNGKSDVQRELVELREAVLALPKPLPRAVSKDGVNWTYINPPMPEPEKPTLRDQFAMAALQYALAAEYGYKDAVEQAYRTADVMLTAREKQLNNNMSEVLKEIKGLRGNLQIAEFAGPVEVGPMIQISQGLAGSAIGVEGDLGLIQLTLKDVSELVPALVEWMKADCERRAEILRVKIAEDKRLEKTIFSAAAECSRFIAEFNVPQYCVQDLARIVCNDAAREVRG